MGKVPPSWAVGKHLPQWAVSRKHFVNVLLLFFLVQHIQCHLQELDPQAEGPESI